MASRRITVALTAQEHQALQRMSKAEGVSQAELIRRGIRTVTARHQNVKTGWLALSSQQLKAMAAESFGDFE